MALNVKPTRSELLNLKKRIKLAKNGHSLLKKKRDGLIMEFFELMKEAKTLRSEMVADYKEAVQNLKVARTVTTELYLKSLALAITQHADVEADTKNVMGIRVPKLELACDVTKACTDRGYGIIGGSSLIDAAVHKYENVVQKAVKVAETEVSMKKILAEIEKTKRRVNALEFAVIPDMEKARDFVAFRLEEMERDTISSMKHIKGKHDKAA